MIINLNSLKTYQGLVKLPEYGLIEAKGEDTKTFLQGQFTCDMNTLKSSIANRGCICSHKGRILASFYLHQTEDGFWILMFRDNIAQFLEHIKKFAACSKVTLKDVSEQWHIAGAIGDHEISNTALQLKIQDDFNRTFIITADPNPLWQNNTVWHGLNVLAGICDIDANTSLLFTPQMIDLQKFDGVSFKKGCYVGQEIVARTEHLGKLKRHLQRLTLPLDNSIAIGMPLKNEAGQSVGTITEYYRDNESCHILAVVEDHADYNNLIL